MKYLVLTLLFAASLAAGAQQQLPPCGYNAYPCLNLDSSGPAIREHAPDPVIAPPAAEAGTDSVEIYQDQQEWLFAQRWIDVNTCHAKWNKKVALGMQYPSMSRKVAYLCHWR